MMSRQHHFQLQRVKQSIHHVIPTSIVSISKPTSITHYERLMRLFRLKIYGKSFLLFYFFERAQKLMSQCAVVVFIFCYKIKQQQSPSHNRVRTECVSQHHQLHLHRPSHTFNIPKVAIYISSRSINCSCAYGVCSS